jgi:hypothetical protein
MISISSMSVQRPGTNNIHIPSTLAGNTDIVAAGSNPNGLIIRTILCAGVTGSINVNNGSNAYFFECLQNSRFSYLGSGLLIPPGQPLRVNSPVAGNWIYLTWDAF